MSQRFLTPRKRKSGFVPPPPPPIITYRILAEDGLILNTAKPDRLRTQQNTP